VKYLGQIHSEGNQIHGDVHLKDATENDKATFHLWHVTRDPQKPKRQSSGSSKVISTNTITTTTTTNNSSDPMDIDEDKKEKEEEEEELPKDLLAPNKELTGTFYNAQSFIMSIFSRVGEQFNGSITWDKSSKRKASNFEGKIQERQLSFKEGDKHYTTQKIKSDPTAKKRKIVCGTFTGSEGGLFELYL
jgi:hypothetical protein